LWALAAYALFRWVVVKQKAVAMVVALAVFVSATWFYLKSSTAVTKAGKYGMGIFVAFLILVNVMNVFGPLMDDSKLNLTVSALAAYFLFAGIAFWLDLKRI
jgi:hypothetical protein